MLCVSFISLSVVDVTLLLRLSQTLILIAPRSRSYESTHSMVTVDFELCFLGLIIPDGKSILHFNFNLLGDVVVVHGSEERNFKCEK